MPDMGSPRKITDPARDLIRMPEFRPDADIKIEYSGLRPGEKLYKEKLMAEEGLRKTDNDLIFIERDKPLKEEEVEEKLDILREALSTGNDSKVKEALMKVVPTYHMPEEINPSFQSNAELTEFPQKQDA